MHIYINKCSYKHTYMHMHAQTCIYISIYISTPYHVSINTDLARNLVEIVRPQRSTQIPTPMDASVLYIR